MPLTEAQISLLARGYIFYFSPKAEYIMAMQKAWLKLSSKAAEELRAETSQLLKHDYPLNLTFPVKRLEL